MYFLLTVLIIFLAWEWMVYSHILVLSHKDDVHFNSMNCKPHGLGPCMDLVS